MLFRNILFLGFCFLLGANALNLTIGELPQEIARELKETPLKNLITGNLNCPYRLKPELQKVHFYLYDRANKETPIKFQPEKIKIGGKKLIVLIHGWLSTSTSTQMQDLKNTYLDKYDCNVLMIDWSKAALLPYKTSYCYITFIAQLASKLMCHLGKKMNVKLNEVHVVGHSMGAQIAGLMGQFVLKKCRTNIGRLTALDPINELRSPQLTTHSAEFTNVIHTDIEGFGSNKNYGHADFYANCGYRQPGCPNIAKVSDDDLLSDVMCSHLRSIELMTESVESVNAVSISCANCPRYCRPDAGTETYNIMGEPAIRPLSAKSKAYTLITNQESPYFTAWEHH